MPKIISFNFQSLKLHGFFLSYLKPFSCEKAVDRNSVLNFLGLVYKMIVAYNRSLIHSFKSLIDP